MDLVCYSERVEALSATDKVTDSATLPFEERRKTRLRIVLDRSGSDAALLLPRGSVLRNGDLLRAAGAGIIRIIADKEALSTVSDRNAERLARAAYHLGNRHAWVQLGDGWIRYPVDRVLDRMLVSLGYRVTHRRASFEPEGGAYRAVQSHNHG